MRSTSTRSFPIVLSMFKIILGAQASPPRHWSLLQGHEYHEQLCQRPLREDCC